MMNIYLNDRIIKLHRGMKVKHALSAEDLRDVRTGSKVIRDHRGNMVGLEGSLTPGARLYISEGESGTFGSDPP